MDSSGVSWLASAARPLNAKLGGGVTVYRDGDSVCWAYEGQSAVVKLLPNGRMNAVFIGCQGIDAVSSRPAAAAYRSRAAYALTPASCSRMIADMADFFSGEREPKFRFVDAY